jgi:FkbM family methyltransferase
VSVFSEKLRRVARIQWRRGANAVARRAPEKSQRSRHGAYTFAYPSRSIVGRAVAGGLIWDSHLLGVVQALPPDAVVCEVGANIGASLLTMAAAREDLRFICFEPSPRFLPYLHDNVERNGLADRVTVEESLVGPDGGEWELVSNESTGSAAVARYDRHRPLESSRFRSVGLDRYFSGLPGPSFLKIDTDGFEVKVLASAGRLLRETHPALFVEYTPALLQEAGDDGDTLRSLLLEAGYRSVDVYSGEGALVEQDRPLELAIETSSYVDLLLRSS